MDQLTVYMDTLSAVRTLKRDKETELWQAYKQDGCLQARNQIIEAYQPLVYKIAHGICKKEPQLDLIQDGIIGLIQAVERFDPSKGVLFTTYAPFRIRGVILNSIDMHHGKSAFRKDIKVWSLDEVYESSNDLHRKNLELPEDAEAIAMSELHMHQICDAIKTLNGIEFDVIHAIYVRGLKSTEVANEMGISISYTSRIRKKALEKLRRRLIWAVKES